MQFKPIASTRLSHPLLSAFRNDEREYFKTVRLYRYFPVEVNRNDADGNGDADTNAASPLTSSSKHDAPTVLMRLPDDTPLLAEASLGDGRVLLMGVPATPKWSNLPLKPEFVPLMLRSVAYLQRPAKAQAPSVVMPGQPAPIRLTGRWTNAEVQAIDPAGKPHAIELHRDGMHYIGAMLETEQKGYYTFEVSPRAEGAPQRMALGFAVNAEADETALATIDEPRVRELLAPTTVTFMQADPDDPLLAQQLTAKRELWRTLIWITFAVIGAEFLMSTLRPRSDAQQRARALGGPRGPVGRVVDRLRDSLSPVGAGQG